MADQDNQREFDLTPENTDPQKEETSTEPEVDPTIKEQERHGQESRIHFANFFKSGLGFIRSLLDIRHGADIPGTIEGIRKDIDFKGINVWILIFSIFIASIGLNVGSTAVIIGAMLISPLMGPILGIGLALGINDWKMLIRSSRSLLTAVSVSLLTSFIYFKLTPLQELQEELLNRTEPTLLDVFVALFGGLAGIIAGSRKEKSNVIPGVAIATALMPPLCTAGYGLASGNYNFFLGAFYLFLLNSLFISISTYAVVRILKFPVKEFVSAKREKKVRRYIIATILVIIIPSGYLFYGVIQNSYFRVNAEKYINENFRFEESAVSGKELIFNREGSMIRISIQGEPLSENTKSALENRLADYGLEGVTLKIIQAKENENGLGITQFESEREEKNFYKSRYFSSEEKIKGLQEKIDSLNLGYEVLKGDTIPFRNLEKELKIQYRDLQRLAYGEMLESNFVGAPDTIPTFIVEWREGTVEAMKDFQTRKLQDLLKVRLGLDTVGVIVREPKLSSE